MEEYHNSGRLDGRSSALKDIKVSWHMTQHCKDILGHATKVKLMCKFDRNGVCHSTLAQSSLMVAVEWNRDIEGLW